MEPPYPKKREKIRITDQPSGDSTIYIVVDEDTDRYYKFGPLEFMLFWGLDGQTPLEKIKESADQQFNVDIPLEQLTKFVEDLKNKELLEGVERKVVKRKIWSELFISASRLSILTACSTPSSLLFRLRLNRSLSSLPWCLSHGASFIPSVRKNCGPFKENSCSTDGDLWCSMFPSSPPHSCTKWDMP